MAQTCEVEVWVLVDADGNAVASVDADSLAELYDDQIGNGAEMPRRRLKLVVQVPLPADMELHGEAPAQGGQASLRVA